MTVVYTHVVATGSSLFGNFRKLLFRWTGGIYKVILLEFAVYVFMYYCINVPYRFFIAPLEPNDEGRIYFHKFVHYSREAASLIPLQFILGFYVSQVVTRWWNQYMTTPWPDTLAVVTASSVRGHDDRGRLLRRTIVRYINAALVMIFCMISPQAKKRFPTLDDLVQAGFFVPHERLIIESLNEITPGPKYFVPLVWAGAAIVKARQENRIQDDIASYNLLKEVCKFRKLAQDLLSYDWICIPLVYTQVATLAAYVYFFSCLFGKQLIDDPDEVDIYVPVFLFLEFVFMMGWLKVAENLLSPFGDDDDDFEVNWLIDRNITVSYEIVDELNNDFPEMLKDAFWDGIIPDELLYTLDALKYKSEGMGGGSAATKEEKDTMSVVGDNVTTAGSGHLHMVKKDHGHHDDHHHHGHGKAKPADEEAPHPHGHHHIESDTALAKYLEHGKATTYKDSNETVPDPKKKKDSEPKSEPKSEPANENKPKANKKRESQDSAGSDPRPGPPAENKPKPNKKRESQDSGGSDPRPGPRTVNNPKPNNKRESQGSAGSDPRPGPHAVNNPKPNNKRESQGSAGSDPRPDPHAEAKKRAYKK